MIEAMIAFMMINYNCDQRHAGHQVDTFSLEMKMSLVNQDLQRDLIENQAFVAMFAFNTLY